MDDTLVRSASTKRIPLPAVVSRLRELNSQGAEMYLWSSAGAAYAREAAQEVGLDDCFVGFLPKPQVYIDDQAVSEWRYCRHVHPSQVDSV